MPNKTKGTDRRGSVLECLRGGKAVPKELLRRHMAEVKRSLEARFIEKSVLVREAAGYRRKIDRPIAEVAGGGGQVGRALDGLRGISERVAKRRLAVPRVPAEAAGIRAGMFGVEVVGVTPPYDYATGVQFLASGRALAGSADKNSGQMKIGNEADIELDNFDSGFVEMGIYFRPLFGPAILRVSASPAFTFSWSANANTGFAFSSGGVSLGVLGYRGTSGVIADVVQDFTAWNELTLLQELRFDFGSNSSNLSVQLQVEPSSWYVVFVRSFVEVFDGGWPDGAATANLFVTVPAITLGVELTHVGDVIA